MASFEVVPDFVAIEQASVIIMVELTEFAAAEEPSAITVEKFAMATLLEPTFIAITMAVNLDNIDPIALTHRPEPYFVAGNFAIIKVANQFEQSSTIVVASAVVPVVAPHIAAVEFADSSLHKAADHPFGDQNLWTKLTLFPVQFRS